jgi:hypothetical protein
LVNDILEKVVELKLRSGAVEWKRVPQRITAQLRREPEGSGRRRLQELADFGQGAVHDRVDDGANDNNASVPVMISPPANISTVPAEKLVFFNRSRLRNDGPQQGDAHRLFQAKRKTRN